MAFYYVKTGGTADGTDNGRYATKQTGSFAGLGSANYYSTITAALAATTAPVAGDVIVCSNLYDFDNGSSIITRSFPEGIGVLVISVDDTAIDTYAFGAKEQTNSNIRTAGNVYYVGFIHDTSASVEASTNSSVIYKASLINLTSTTDFVAANQDGAKLELIDCEINCAASSNSIRASNGGWVILRNVDFTGTNLTNLIASSYTNGGGKIDVYGCDLSIVTGTLNGDGGDQNFDDLINVDIDMCKIATGVARSVALSNYNQGVYVTRCSDASTGHDYNFGFTGFAGEVDQDVVTYRNEDPSTAESNVQLSYKIVTNANCSVVTPLVIKFPNPSYFELSGTAQDVLSLFLTSNEALTNNDFYVEVTYPDGTNKETPNKVSSENTAYFSDGTALTTDVTSTWTGGLSNNYQVDLDTSGNPGSDSEPIVTVTVTKPNITINLGSIIEGS